MAIDRLSLSVPANEVELEPLAARSELEEAVNRAFAPLYQAVREMRQDVQGLRQDIHSLRVEMAEQEARQDHRLLVFALATAGANVATISAGVGIVLAFN